jgi:hypothetical protein
VSHQLSPVFIIADIVALLLLAGRPPPWMLAAFVLAEAWWLWRAYAFVSRHFHLVSFDQSANVRGAYDPSRALAGVSEVADASRAVILGVALLALAGFVRRARAGHRDLLPAALAVVPVAVAALQSYDGEGPLRAYLFALPWLAFCAAAAWRPGPGVRAASALGAATVVLGAGTLLGYFGQDLGNEMSVADVAASRWLLDHEPRSAVAYVAPNFPARLNAGYVGNLDAPSSLLDDARLQGRPLGPADLPRIAARLEHGGTNVRLLVTSPSQERYARLYGLAPRGAFDRLGRTLLASGRFRLVYRRGGAMVFELTGGPTASRGRRPGGG